MAKMYNRGNGQIVAEWTAADDKKLIECTEKHNGELGLIVQDFEYNRSYKAIRNRQTTLRKRGIMVVRLRDVGNDASSMLTYDAAEELVTRLTNYWLARGFTEHKFTMERVRDSNRYVVRSNLVGGRPPGKPNPALRTRESA